MEFKIDHQLAIKRLTCLEKGGVLLFGFVKTLKMDPKLQSNNFQNAQKMRQIIKVVFQSLNSIECFMTIKISHTKHIRTILD